MSRSDRRSARRLPAVGAMALALLLAGCGLKGALDPPPAGDAGPGRRRSPGGPPPPERRARGRSRARKRIFLDLLLD